MSRGRVSRLRKKAVDQGSLIVSGRIVVGKDTLECIFKEILEPSARIPGLSVRREARAWCATVRQRLRALLVGRENDTFRGIRKPVT